MIQTITIGVFSFHMYGLLLGVAITSSWWWATRLIRRAGNNALQFDQTVVWVIVMGVVGARLYHVVDYWWYYFQHLKEIIYIWQGGLGIWGAIGGGLLGLGWVTRKELQRRRMYVDAIALSLPLGQAIGRWGNWVNFELYGQPTFLPWKWYIPWEYRPATMKEVAYYHPLFFYESVLSLLLFVGLGWGFRKYQLGKGRALGAYLVGYGLIRLCLEPLRIEPWRWGVIPVATVFSIIAIGAGGWWWIRQQAEV